MLNVIVFTKNRSFQLDAYLNSLISYTEIEYDHINLITPDWINAGLIYPVNQFSEKAAGGFSQALSECLEIIQSQYDPDKNVLLSTDDSLFTKPFCLRIADNALCKNDDCIGFSLRLGINSHPYHNSWNVSQDKRFIKWHWPSFIGTHFGYPFDLSQSVYRVSFVKEILSLYKDKINIPNDLESYGVQHLYKNPSKQYMMAINDNSYAYMSDLNRVQDVYCNRIQGGPEHSAENLNKLYNEGYRLDITNHYNIVEPDPFIGAKHFKLTKG